MDRQPFDLQFRIPRPLTYETYRATQYLEDVLRPDFKPIDGDMYRDWLGDFANYSQEKFVRIDRTILRQIRKFLYQHNIVRKDHTPTVTLFTSLAKGEYVAGRMKQGKKSVTSSY